MCRLVARYHLFTPLHSGLSHDAEVFSGRSYFGHNLTCSATTFSSFIVSGSKQKKIKFILFIVLCGICLFVQETYVEEFQELQLNL